MNIAGAYSKNSYISAYESKEQNKIENHSKLKSVHLNGSQAKCMRPATPKRQSGLTLRQGTANSSGSIRDNLRNLAEGKIGNTANSRQQVTNNSILNNIRDYGNSIKAQRLNQQSTNNNLKKLKYHFKSIASKIVRSKTSSSARQVVGQAKREIIRLKKEKQSGKYNSEEIDAAITHAKTMERIARKKVRHLEEEEMAKATGGPCADRDIDEEEIRDREKDAYDKLDEAEEKNLMEQSAADELYGEENYLDEYALEDLEVLNPDMLAMYMDMSDTLDSMEVLMSDMEELTSEMMDEFAQSMQDMLEEMGLDELSEGAVARKGDMDPADLKALKIKHRNKEMKEIVKADAEYLKVIFDQLEKERTGGGSSTIPGNSGGVVSAMSGGVVPEGGIAIEGSSHASIIDVSL